MSKLYRSIRVFTLAWLIGSCGGGDGIVGPPAPTVASVTVSRDTATLVPAATLQLTASARTAAGEPLSRSFSWSTSNAGTATVSSSGMVVGVAPGTATITAATDGKSATTSITVLDGGVVSSTGGTLVLAGGAVQIVVPADAVASNTNLSVAISTAVAGDPRVVAASAFEFGPTGTQFAKPVALKVHYNPANLPPGTEEAALELYLRTSAGWEAVPQSVPDLTAKTVSAPISHFSTYAILTPEAVAAIAIVGASPLTVGEAKQLTATLTDAGGDVLTNRVVTWSTSDAAVASVTQTGDVAGLKPGSASISAAAGGITSSVQITVNPVPVAALTLSTPTTPMTVGETQALTALPKNLGGVTLNGRTVNWVSSNPAVLTVSAPSSVSTAGGATVTVTAAGPGTGTITATSEAMTATTLAITVNPVPPPPVNTITLTPPSAVIVVGGTQQLVAALKDAAGNALVDRAIEWASSNPAVATVDARGLVTAVSPGGPVTITAASEGKSATTSITVTPVPVASVAVSPTSATLVVGATESLTATVRDAANNALAGRTVTWSSSDNAIATVNEHGVVTAVSAGGPVTIAATSETKIGTASVTVTVAPVATVTLSAPTTPMTMGETQVLTAATLGAGGAVLTGRTVNWVSSNPGVLSLSASSSVSISSGATLTIIAVSPGTAAITATSDAASATTALITVNPVPPPPVATVTVTPASASIVVGGTQQLAATLKDAHDNALTGRAIEWTSSNAAVATVDAHGLVTAVSPGGPVTITATSEAKTGTASITVTVAPVATVTVSPPTTPMIVDQTQELATTLHDAAGNVLVNRTVSWTSSNPAVLTVNPPSATSGTTTVTAVGPGIATITATSELAPSATTPSITVNPVPVAAVSVTPASATLVLGITPSQQLTAVTRDAIGNELTGRTVTWTSSDEALARVDATGRVTAVGSGTATITATSETKTGTSSITVTVAPVATVMVSTPTTPVTVGDTQLLTALPQDATGATLSGRTVNWVSSNPNVLTVSVSSSVSSSSGATVTVTATGPGTATITVTSEVVNATTPVITVNPVPPPPVASVTLTPSAANIVVGETRQLTATLRDAANNQLSARTVTWSSANPAIATVDQNGLVTTVSAGGPVTISATSETKTGTASITVTVAPVATVTVAPPSTPMIVGQTQQLTATLHDAAGNVLANRTVSWISSNTAVLTVNPPSGTSGTTTVTAVGVGTATITATSETKAGTSSITVQVAPVNTVTVTPASASLIVGATRQLTATLHDAANNELTGREVTWTSDNTGIATVNANGLVSAVGAGSATISATSETKIGTASITVTVAPVATLTLSTPTTPMIVGKTQVLTAAPQDATGATLTGRIVTWVSSDPAVLRVGASTSVSTPSGATVTVTAVGLGSATITATSESAPAATTPVIAVIPVPVTSVTVTPTTATFVVGATQQMTATVRDAVGNELSGRTVTWSSTDNAIASVDGNGLVTGVTAGGPVTITATSETVTGTASAIVTPAPVTSVTLFAPTTPMIVGGTQVLTATTMGAGGVGLTGRTVNWVSSSPSVLSLSASSSVSTSDGATVTVTAIGQGTATITATSELAPAATTSLITVNPVPVAAVSVTPASTTLVLGITTTQRLTAVTTDANGNTLAGRLVTWSSSNVGAATVDQAGLVTAVGQGTTTVTATSETKSGTSAITVMVAPVTTVTVSAPTTPMVVGETQQLTATLHDAAGNVLANRSVIWVSSDPAVVAVSPASSTSGTTTVTAVGVGAATITATSESASATTPVITVNPVPVASVTVSPASANLMLGITPTQQLTAVTRDGNGNALPDRLITWTSSDEAVARVDATGRVTAVGSGTATITATSETKTGTSSITVTVAPVATVTLSAATTPMIVGQTQELTATLHDAVGNVLTNRTVSWASSDPAVLTVSPASSTSGTTTVTALGVGTATITAMSESAPAATTSLITVNPVPVAAVSVTPPSATLVLGISPTQQLTALTTDANGNELTGRLITWSSSDETVATVNASGLVTALGPGSTTVTATSETRSGTSAITVTVAPVTTVALSTLTTPMTVGETQLLTATPQNATGTTLSGRTVNWVSGNLGVLAVSVSNSVSTSSGATVTVTAVGPGTATITATSESAPSAATPLITVNPVPVETVTLTPSAATMVLGVTPTRQLTATLRDAANNELTGRTVTWSSDNDAIATVDQNGLVTAVNAGGPVTITATSETKIGTASITVIVAPVATVTVSTPTTPMVLGETQSLTATTTNAVGATLTGRTVTWVSSDPAVLTVNPSSGTSGTTTVTAVGLGTATITAMSESVSSSPTPVITVNPVPVAAVSVTPASATLVLGITPTQQLTAVTTDANGNELTGRLITWSSSDQTVATVDQNGFVTAIGAGATTITATSETKSGTSAITVTVAPVTTVTLSTRLTQMMVGDDQVLTATPQDAAGAILSGRTVNWVSSNPEVLAVSVSTSVSTSSGATVTVTAITPGTATITATSENAPSATTPVITVTVPPVATVTLFARMTQMVVGDDQVLTATPQDATGATLSGRMVNWVSSNPEVLTVSASSSVSTSSGATVTVVARALGTATITATSETAPGATSVITVIPVPVATVTVSPDVAMIIVGRSRQLSAVTRDDAGHVLTGRTVTWVSANPAVVGVDANGVVTAEAVGGPVEITATSEGKTGTSSFTVIPMPAWRGNEPAGMTFIKERSFTDLNEPTWATLGGSGATIATDPAAPRSPSNVLRVDYPAGFTGGSAPASTETSISGDRVLYFCYWIKHSANWQGHSTGVSKHGYVWMGNTPLFVFEAEGSGSNPLTARMALQGAPLNNDGWYTQNLHPEATFTRGEWDYVEILLTGNTSGAANGELDVYLNGVHVSHWTGIQYSAHATRWDLFRIFPVWGGVGDVVNADQYLDWDHVYMSGRDPPPPVARVTVSTPTTPMIVGQTQELTATVTDAAGNVLTDRTVTWVSSDPAVLTVNPASGGGASATVTAVGAGRATITATSETQTATSSITVTGGPVASVTLSTLTTPMIVGGTQVLTATPKDAAGAPLANRVVNWVSSNPSVLTLSASSSVSTPSGATVTVTAAGAGTATISATSEAAPSATTPDITVGPATPVTLRADPFITTGLDAPLFLTQPLNDGRIFVVEQPGTIRVVLNGALQSTPFLDIHSKLIFNGERGLLSVAFHPQYASNHFFYVYYIGLSGQIVIERYTTTADASVADAASGKVIFTTPHPVFDNHNGGLVSFGPDGMLYAAFGDGGGGGDPDGNGQNSNAYLGGMIRIDVDHGDPYSVPSDNPFVGQADRKPELWSKGLRNPWRYAFDPPSGSLYIADVGQNVREEIDVMPASQGGINYGWNTMEGLICYNATTCDQTGLQPPILDFQHVGGACSITGGYVYRGSAIPEIRGHYFYSDWCAGWLRSLRYQGGVALDQKDWGFTFPNKAVTSFGQDFSGELYVMSGDGIYKLVRGP